MDYNILEFLIKFKKIIYSNLTENNQIQTILKSREEELIMKQNLIDNQIKEIESLKFIKEKINYENSQSSSLIKDFSKKYDSKEDINTNNTQIISLENGTKNEEELLIEINLLKGIIESNENLINHFKNEIENLKTEITQSNKFVIQNIKVDLKFEFYVRNKEFNHHYEKQKYS